MRILEFLDALGDAQLREYLSNVTLENGVEEIAHQTLLERLRLYLVLGGMPALVKDYINNKIPLYLAANTIFY